MNSIVYAIDLAKRAHAGQVRKNGLTPYIFHPMRVMNLVALLDYTTEDMICAAVLHDVKEDCEVKYWNELVSSFGNHVVHLVGQLTNEFTHAKYPKLNRAERKAKELERLRYIHPDAKIIKCCDRYDNLQDLVNQPDRDYARLYLRESKALLDAIKVGCSTQASFMLSDCLKQKRIELDEAVSGELSAIAS